MVSLKSMDPEWVAGLYRDGEPDLPFADILGRAGGEADDESLAELIENDGRARLAAGRPVELERYLAAISNLHARVVPLDAAIDVTLRAMCPDGRPTPAAVDRLIGRHPGLAEAIHGAALLGEAIWSTSTLKDRASPSPHSLPPDVGPLVRWGTPRYQIQRLLGSGGWGAVYLAADRQLSEPDHPALVAVKLFASAGADLWERQRMADEATKARRVLHDNVVRVLDLGVSDRDEDYIVYEYIDGGDLRTWVQRHPFPMDQRRAAAMVAKIARGVQAAHAAGLVHCDLKPGNILITAPGEPKVADFGIAVRAGEREEPWQRGDSGRPAGNLAFISPEQYRMEEGSLCIPSDIYALGGILFYLLTGNLPNGATAEEISRTHEAEGGRKYAPSPRGARPQIDKDLGAICQRAMAVLPEDRYSSAGALADDLESFLRHEPIRWTRPGPARVVRLWIRRRPGVAAASLLALVAILTGSSVGGYWWFVASLRSAEARYERSKIAAASAATQKMGMYFSLLGRHGLDEEMLPQLLAMEWLNGSAFLGKPGEPTAMWQQRNAIVRSIVNQARNAGQGKSVETLLWQGTLGLWLLDGGRIDEAEPLLKQTAEDWQALVDHSDPWAGRLNLLVAAAGIRRIEALGGRKLSDDQREELRAFGDILATEGTAFAGPAAGGPAHCLVLRAAADLYGPRLLHDNAARRRVIKRLDSLKK